MNGIGKSSMNSVALFEEKVSLIPSDFSGRNTRGQKVDEEIDIESLLLEKLAARLEGKCSQHGYVVPGSLTLLSRSMGYVENGRFTGDIVYHVQAEGDVIYPPDGTVLEGRVEKMNTMGMFVVYEVKDKKNPESNSYPAIKIILPRDLQLGKDEFNSVEPGDQVSLEIKKSRFQVNDEFILCVGDFRSVLTKARPAVEDEQEESTQANTNEEEEENKPAAEGSESEEEEEDDDEQDTKTNENE
jgi:DNA-directed RNA polymerase subunit E'/Rpb7